MKTQRLKAQVDELAQANDRLEAALKCVAELDAQVTALSKQSAQLQDDVKKLQMQKDILVECAKVIKKDESTNLEIETLSNREKARVIGALRDRYLLKDLCVALKIAKSSYCFQKKALERPDKYSDLKEKIKSLAEENARRYGYRRIWFLLKRMRIVVSEKIVRRLMKELQLFVTCPRMKKYSSYVGEVSPAVPNLLKRDFHAAKPNEKWLTDITEFSLPVGKVYLSPVIDCFDGMPVAWKVGTSPNALLANSMLQDAISTLKPGEKPIIHSDRGGHYRWPGWIDITQAAGLTRSMSKKGCSPDNSACEGFFGTIKKEMFYGRQWQGVSVQDFMAVLNTYLHWFRESRIKVSLGGLSPMEFRASKGYC